jgi:hypothetical protein
MLFPKTIHDVKTSRDIRRRPGRLSQQVFRKRALVYPLNPIDQNKIAIELQREGQRFRRQEEALERSRKRIEGVRAKLYAAYEKNHRLTQFRHQLQKERWERLGPGGSGASQTVTEQPTARKPLKHRIKQVRIRRT